MGKKIEKLQNHQNKSRIKKISKFQLFAKKKTDKTKKKDSRQSKQQKPKINNFIASQTRVSNKKIKFDLQLDQQDKTLRHRGKNLRDVSNFNQMQQESQQYSNNQVDQANFGGFQQGHKKKSRSQIYEQIIKKSKKNKMQKQLTLQQNNEDVLQMNDNYNDLKKDLIIKAKGQQKGTFDDFNHLLRQLQSQRRIKGQSGHKYKKQNRKSQIQKYLNNSSQQSNDY